MIIELGLGAALLVAGERAYKAYKNGTLLSDITTAGSTLKTDVAAIEAKIKAGTAVVEADYQKVVVSAKTILSKL